MAIQKRRLLILSSGKQIKLNGCGVAISKSLEIGEAFVPNILSLPPGDEAKASVSNPFKLTVSDINEIADYNIQLWLQLRENLRKFEMDNPKIFSSDTSKSSADE